MNDLQSARQLLASGDYTCVLCRGDQIYTSNKRGVAPLLELLDAGVELTDFSAADKVIGKATAMLYRLLGVKAVYAGVISDIAVETLEAGGIHAQWESRVPHIINRTGDGRCPMETATALLDDPREALAAIRAKQAELRS